MLTIKNYVRPKTLDEAYELCQKKTNVVLGGMLWLKMQTRNVNTAIDLCDLGLDRVSEEEDCYRIGAMVSLRMLETHQGLNALTQNAFAESVQHIVGVQFRNGATVGGSLYGRFGFSDVLTLFQVLHAKVRLHHMGELSMQEFAQLPRGTRDILVEVIVPKKPMKVCYLSQRNTATDFPVLACAVSSVDGKICCAVGARPAKAIALSDETGILANGIDLERAQVFGDYVAQKLDFGSNMRASAAYRKKICAVLVRRAVLSLKEG